MRRGIAVVVALTGTLVAASSAQAAFHLMKISEIGQGGAGGPDYVELQMHATGQNFVGGHTIVSYDAMGGPLATFTFPVNVAEGGDQRTILVARDDGTLPVTADFVSANLIVPNDGAICFDDIDCVAFGAFTGTIPSPAGTPAPVAPPGGALQRSIAPGCATLLEPGDDTNNSAADFALGTPSPRNNATAPTEVACGDGGGGGDTDPPQTTITKSPEDEFAKAKAKLKFRSSEPRSEFRCKLDKGKFRSCDSPFKKSVDVGKHKFKVYAIDQAGNRDPSPAKARFKRVDD